ncbi:rfbP protein [Vibrio anguillarum]|nr:rfbP protein [Vibrio anguillarum]
MVSQKAASRRFVVTPKPPPWAVVIEPWGYCPQKCPC